MPRPAHTVREQHAHRMWTTACFDRHFGCSMWSTCFYRLQPSLKMCIFRWQASCIMALGNAAQCTSVAPGRPRNNASTKWISRMAPALHKKTLCYDPSQPHGYSTVTSMTLYHELVQETFESRYRSRTYRIVDRASLECFC
jgi:hypothetical protein